MSELALTYNDQSVLENFHAALLASSWLAAQIGRMEKKMETTGIIGFISGL